MDFWIAWGASGAGALFLALAIYGYATRPGAPLDATVKHATYRIWTPLLLAWLFLWRELPNALHAPWAVDASCDFIGLIPAVIVFFAMRRRRAAQDGSAGPVK
ncbi:hypothetical protein ACN2WE_39760 [Streptomyces sp. cg28]|uniref:hypothetical protein n=1 Tax=Streptomyces sp. cg28 TaxID=3403457 RepID=UPI003B213847